MMHRALCRVFRGTCRKFRENDCSVAVGEEARKGQQKEEFVPPKPRHSLEEAVAWTAGLTLAYQVTHRHRRTTPEGTTPTTYPSSDKCLFSVASKAISQPTLAGSTKLHAARKAIIPSIDLTPFIHDDLQDSTLPDRISSASTVDDDDIVFEFDPVDPPPSSHSPADPLVKDPVAFGTRYAADLLSVLGAFEYLKVEEEFKAKGITPQVTPVKKKSKQSAVPSPMHAIELMQKGAELGSSRALYNIGVAYERMSETKLAREYYKKAADLGHPLATYNCAVFALKDGHLSEGVALMKEASDFGVPEAAAFMKPSEDLLAVQLEVGKV